MKLPPNRIGLGLIFVGLLAFLLVHHNSQKNDSKGRSFNNDNSKAKVSIDATAKYWLALAELAENEELFWELLELGGTPDGKQRSHLFGATEIMLSAMLNYSILAYDAGRASKQYRKASEKVRSLTSVGVAPEFLELGVLQADRYARMAALCEAYEGVLIENRKQADRLTTLMGALEVYGAAIADLFKRAERIPSATETIGELKELDAKCKALTQKRSSLISERDQLKTKAHAVRSLWSSAHRTELPTRLPVRPARAVVVQEYVSVTGAGLFRDPSINLHCKLRNAGNSGEFTLFVQDTTTGRRCTPVVRVTLDEGSSADLELQTSCLPEDNSLWGYVIEGK